MTATGQLEKSYLKPRDRRLTAKSGRPTSQYRDTEMIHDPDAMTRFMPSITLSFG